MTAREQQRFEKLATAIRRIAAYMTPKQLQREYCRDDSGLAYAEALEMAYENIREEARAVVHLVRPRKSKSPAASQARTVGSDSLVSAVENRNARIEQPPCAAPEAIEPRGREKT